ncbi:hypothetical protein VDG1235_1117 [Verrucomicrobiia bacterium DG1235]|nr:hypothetical protein VDG1235_1117 [Verrucomicrobiae bacterium DG1235]
MTSLSPSALPLAQQAGIYVRAALTLRLDNTLLLQSSQEGVHRLLFPLFVRKAIEHFCRCHRRVIPHHLHHFPLCIGYLGAFFHSIK